MTNTDDIRKAIEHLKISAPVDQPALGTAQYERASYALMKFQVLLLADLLDTTRANVSVVDKAKK